MHLGIVRAEELAPPASADLAAMILDALEHAGPDGLERASLRAAVRVRNERVGEALTRLAAAGHIVRRGDWCAFRSPLQTRIGTGTGIRPPCLPERTSVTGRRSRTRAGSAGKRPATHTGSLLPVSKRRGHPGGEVNAGGVRGAEPHDACSLSSRHQTATIPSMQCGPVQYVSCAKAIERNWSRQEKFCTL